MLGEATGASRRMIEGLQSGWVDMTAERASMILGADSALPLEQHHQALKRFTRQRLGLETALLRPTPRPLT